MLVDAKTLTKLDDNGYYTSHDVLTNKFRAHMLYYMFQEICLKLLPFPRHSGADPGFLSNHAFVVAASPRGLVSQEENLC